MKNVLIVLCLLFNQFLFAQNGIVATYRDSVFKSDGAVWVGKINIDKDANKYFFVSDTIAETELDTKNVLRFVIFPNENENDQLTYYSIIGEFYLLESSPNDVIMMYAKHTYKSVENDGPKYYTVKKKYCLFKNKVIYFPEKVIFKDIMLFLTNDCFEVNRKVKRNDLGFDDLPTIVAEYNHCGKK